ncbi:MAG: right-handed parallel beta-helix repeat-containing protein [Salinisphaera sp.]|jgi:hypothetical protein|nr:right-handed parallel beta-helix repeat-containing protein [Salinisphaera sp.]
MYRNFNRWLVAAGLLSCLCGPALAADIVNVHSLRGLRQAIASAPATGQIIVLAKGVYHQTRPIDIQRRGHLTISGATSDFDDTVISGPGINDQRVSTNFRVDRSKDVTIRNMTLENSYYHGVQINRNSDYFTANNLKTWDNGESGFKVTSPSHGHGADAYSDYGTIENCVIGFTTAGQRGVVEGIDIVGAVGWDIRSNRLHNIRKPNGHAAYAIFAKGNSQNIVIDNNIVSDSFVALSFGGGGTGARFFRNGDTRYETRGGVIRHNLMYDLIDTGIYLNKAHNFDVYGNTIINNGHHVGAIVTRYPQSSGRIHGNVVSAPIKRRDGGHAVIKNNILVSANAPIPVSSDGPEDVGQIRDRHMPR